MKNFIFRRDIQRRFLSFVTRYSILWNEAYGNLDQILGPQYSGSGPLINSRSYYVTFVLPSVHVQTDADCLDTKRTNT